MSDPVAQVLVRRGMSDPACARAFMEGEEEHPHTAFAGIETAIATILSHVDAGNRITIHGDYDVDGICSTAVLVRALRRLNADVDWYLPDRASDGYGLNPDTVRRLAARGTRLLVSADCAITAVEEVAAARELEMDVVVTDHHSVRADGILPDAPIVHPTVCEYPFRELCATAVAYKLAEGLEGRAPVADLDLVALATIADVVPLLGENRSLVRRGLRALAGTVKPGLRALMAVARVDPARVDERSVAFGLAPRLNAAGRLYRADAGLELILTEDPVRAAQIADELDRVNHERRRAERTIRFEAEAQIAALGDLKERGALVLAGEDWHVGVIGIVASRLAETHHRPVVLIALDGERGRGSGRGGCEAFDLLAGLTACSEHLSSYGGHRAAAGLEIERDRVAVFAGALDAYASSVLSSEDMVPTERVDAIVDGSELGMALAEELGGLAPFGQANPSVSLMIAEATFADVRPMGEGKHSRFTVRSRAGRARAVAFNTGGGLGVAEGEPAQATFTLEVNEWNGVSEPRLVLRRARPAGAPRVEDRRRVPVSTPSTGPAAPASTPAPGDQQELVLFA
ncbi:MAG TPA: single-stranded-DNA-specific exonuclease RecJ [Solirubrobacteraceae bacterium]